MNFIPNEILLMIIQYLPIYYLLRCKQVCNLWNFIVNDILIKQKKSITGTNILVELIKLKDYDTIHQIFTELPKHLKDDVCAYYAYYGDQKMITYCIENGASWTDKAISYLIHGNQVKTLEWAKNNLFVHREIWKMAAFSGSLDILNLIPRHYSNELMEYAIRGGNFEVVKWVHDKRFYYHDNVCLIAAVEKQFDILKWLLMNGSRLDENSRFYAIKYGGESILEWLGDKNPDKISLTLAAKHGYLEIVKKAHANGKIIEDYQLYAAAEYNHKHILEWALQNGYTSCRRWINPCFYASIGNHFDLLKWIVENQYPLCSQIGVYAAKNNNFEMLKWFIDHGGEIKPEVCENAACVNNFEMVKWIIQNGYPWTSKTCIGAVAHNNIEMMKWLHYHIETKSINYVDTKTRISWKKKLVSYAAYKGYLDMVQWLIENNYDYDQETCINAAIGGSHDDQNLNSNTHMSHFTLLKWLINEKCLYHFPISHILYPNINNINIITETARRGHLEIFKWLVTEKFPNAHQIIEYELISTQVINCQLDDKPMLYSITNQNIIHWYEIFNKHNLLA